MQVSDLESGSPHATRAAAICEAGTLGQTMRAVVHDRYGPLEDLRVRDVQRPTVGAEQVLVRVHAAGLHVGDCFAVRGAPFVMRLATGLIRPRCGIPGFDLAGQIEAVGRNVRHLRPGDPVFGVSQGTCAEYVRADPSQLAIKPAALSYAAAAALPTSGLAALHALRDVARVQPGQRVLINGAAGGVGSFAVQLARFYGAEVTAVCGPTNGALVRSLGAEHVIDYTRTDFTRSATRYAVIFDNVENRSLAACRRVLAPDGTLILNSGTGAAGLALLLRIVKPLLLTAFTRQRLRRYLSVPAQADLEVLADLASTGVLVPVLDRSYTLDRCPEALAHIDGGHARGKVVVTIA